ncbi:MAG: YmdB family metallophosphoesterase [Cyanobacteria bacterium SIG26]|nr:YmdB family metallophosphoesterase [Cyanobacteria bacterium SIG26]
MKIIFFGDVVGKPGRNAVRDFLLKNQNDISKNYDFVIANIENASHGFGLTEKNHNDFIEFGVNCMTCGNHIWDKKEIYNYIDKSENLIRPINYPKGTKGVGSRIFDMGDFKIGVINVLGRVFMTLVDSPWEMVAQEVKKIQETTPIIIIDFHAEATAEKICFGRYCSELGISAFFGTHTHVQTADESIINGMGYITDAGFCGASDGVIGMEYSTSLSRFLTSIPERYEVAEGNTTQINAVEVEIEKATGKALAIKRIICNSNNIVEEGQSEEEN